ncbi:Uncharacterised protein [Mycobacteroides abscessus subsp. massiliense]|nr:Uncharacterised protein [Mycobacteroides abscessus subsp. massiliense]
MLSAAVWAAHPDVFEHTALDGAQRVLKPNVVALRLHSMPPKVVHL